MVSHSQALNSDAGGVAARQGFKYQDHIAARHVLEMISDPRIVQVECETSDDITLQWQEDDRVYPEYIQVKTTEKDSKWTIAEISTRESKSKENATEEEIQANGKAKSKSKAKKDNPNSLIEKSLLCDCHGPEARFRIVSSRDVKSNLFCLTLHLSKRNVNEEVEALALKLASKWPTLSSNNNNLGYWVRNAQWEVTGNVSAVEAINHQSIMRIAEQDGIWPGHSHVCEIYQTLLNMVEKAACASKKDLTSDKIITRRAIRVWWEQQLAKYEAVRKRTAKPYPVETDGFFTELHTISEGEIRRALTGYDAQYDRGKWRSEQLAEYLMGWLPELALKASELVQVQPLAMRKKLQDAFLVVEYQRKVSLERILAEILLHTVIRHHFKSEPITPCKLFYQTRSGSKTFGNAHIVRRGSTKDELWLGCATIAPAATYEEVITSVMEELDKCLDPDFLRDEREVILQLMEPQHLRSHTLEKALERNTPVDKLLEILCVSVLIAYDSDTLGQGFTQDYQKKLIDEITKHYGILKGKLPSSISPIRVHIFLVPVECVQTLVECFTAKVKVN